MADLLAGAQGSGLLTLFAVFAAFLGLAKIGIMSRGPVRALAFVGAWLLLTISAAFRVVRRGMGGSDALAYRQVFESFHRAGRLDISESGASSATEPLHLGLMRLVGFFTDDYRAYFFAAYGIITLGVLVFIARTFQPGVSVLPLLLFFPAWLHSFNIMRNWIAIACFLVALTYFLKRRNLGFYIWTFIAIGFHFSTLIMLFLPLFAKLGVRSFRARWLVPAIALINVIVLGGSGLLSRALSGTKYSYYLGLEASNPTIILPLVAITVAGTVACMPHTAPEEQSSKLLAFLYFICSLGTIILAFGGYRYVSYAIVPQAALAAMALQAASRRWSTAPLPRFIWSGVIVAALLGGFLSTLNTVTTLSGVFPYSFSWR